jgi:site-specific recombinase XerD
VIERLPSGKYRVRWYEAGRSAGRRSRTFERRKDARVFEAELTRRRALGEFAYLEAANKRVEDLAKDWWEIYAKPNLAYNTLAGYAPALDKHVVPRLGRLKLREVTPEVLARFRADLEKAGVGRSNVRISLVVVQAMFSRAQEWGWVSTNPAKAVRKPSGVRERAVVCLEPARVEAIRDVMSRQGRPYAALRVCPMFCVGSG